MKRNLFFLFLFAAAVAAAPAQWLGGTSASVERAVERVKPALVRIEVVWTEFENGRAVKHEAAGSGVIIRRDGFVLTNHHVAGHATRLVCILSSNEEIEAELVGTDSLSDLAVLRLKPVKPRVFPTVPFGDSDALAVGDPVLAMGSPLALSQSVTRGIVSNTKLIMSRAMEAGGRFTLDGEDVGSIVRWIAHDATILHGNSGGPLVNLRGEIIGINEIGFGLGGAIPGNLAQRVSAELIERGAVRRAWLGVELQPLLKSGGATEGALVSGVIADSPAARAGLAAGDVLVKLAGEKVNARYAEEVPVLTQMICGMSVGAEIEAVVLRGGQRKIVKLTTAERPLMEPKTRELRTWGVTARNISFIAAREMRLTDTNGVLVTSVRNGGPSGEAKPPLMPGDVVREVAGHRVNNVAELVAVSEEITAGKNTPTPAIVSLDRRRDNVVTVVNIGVKELDEPGMEARKAALSASVQAISRELAAQSGQKEITGVRVTQVYPDSAAAAAGLRVGDWIVSLDGEKIPVSQPGDEETFVQMIRQYRIGTKAVFGVLRGQNRCTLTIELTAAPKPEREMRRYHDPNFEFTARDLTYHDRLARQLAETKPGVIVIEVVGGSWAAVAQLRGGDIIVGVNGEPVKDVASLEKKLKQLVRQRSKEVVLHVQHGIHSRYLELQPDWNHNGSSATKGKS